MKSLFIAYLIFISLCTTAQTIAYDPTCTFLAQFEGEWHYTNGTDTIKIYLRHTRGALGDTTNPDDSPILVSDRLIGWHEYKQGIVVRESNYANRYMYLPFNLGAVYGNFSIDLSFDPRFNACDVNARHLEGFINDLSVCRELRNVTSVIVNQQITEMVWKQKMNEWFGHSTGCYGPMTLPEQFVLIKQ